MGVKENKFCLVLLKTIYPNSAVSHNDTIKISLGKTSLLNKSRVVNHFAN